MRGNEITEREIEKERENGTVKDKKLKYKLKQRKEELKQERKKEKQ